MESIINDQIDGTRARRRDATIGPRDRGRSAEGSDLVGPKPVTKSLGVARDHDTETLFRVGSPETQGNIPPLPIPIDRVIQLINPVQRGWVNYFAVGHSSECFRFIQDWVKEGSAPTDEGSETKGLRLDAVE